MEWRLLISCVGGLDSCRIGIRALNAASLLRYLLGLLPCRRHCLSSSFYLLVFSNFEQRCYT